MNLKVVFRTIIALAFYGVCVFLVLTFYKDSPAKMKWEDREAYNLQFISKLKTGDFTFEQALEKLGSPDITEAEKSNGKQYQVMFYRTQHVKSDGITTQEECTYLLFIDEQLAEIGLGSHYTNKRQNGATDNELNVTNKG